MTLSPTATSSGTRLPLSSTRPGPTARTSPSWGFSLALSGITIPEAVVFSASSALTTIRSSSGLMETDTADLPFTCECFSGVWCRSVQADRRRGGRWASRFGWHPPGESATDHSMNRLALGQGECQRGGLRPPRATRAEAPRSPQRGRIARMDATGLAKLMSPTGWALLSALPPYDERQTLALSERLHREGIDADLVAAALTQSRLRAKAHAKFGDFADGMLFTPAGLEQSTRLLVAAHHARRYTDAGVTKLADLTCGIGADSMAFASMGLTVLAVDTDEVTAAVATVNLRHFPEVEVRHGDGLTLDLAADGVDGIYADPARRTTGGSRVFDPAAYSPPLDSLLAQRARAACGWDPRRASWSAGPVHARRRPGRGLSVRAGRSRDQVRARGRGRGAGAGPARRPDDRLCDVRRPAPHAPRDRVPGRGHDAVRAQAPADLPARARRRAPDDQEARHGGPA